MAKNREISALKLGAASSDRRERTTQENGDYMSIRKIPKWEVEEFTPQDRKYDYSSYAIDQVEKEKVINKVGLLNVKDLKKGRIYSYKELCQLIGDKPQTNPDQKYNQQRKWECFFEFEPISRKGFMITRIYKEPRYANYITAKQLREITNEQHKYIYQVLLMLLYDSNSNPQNDFYEFKATKWQLFRLLGFANELFFKNCLWPGEYQEGNLRYKPAKMSIIEKRFYNDAMQYFSRLLQRALSQLHICKKINYYWEMKVIDKKSGFSRNASKFESAMITKIEGEILNDMGAENVYEIADDGEKLSKFKQKVLDKCGEVLNIKNYWDEIDVWVVKTNVRTGIMRMYQRFKGFGDDISKMQKQYQAEGAMMMNQLITNYFYELNTRAAERYAEYLYKDSDGMISDNDMSGSYLIVKCSRDAMVKKYLEIKDYLQEIRHRELIQPIAIEDKKEEKNKQTAIKHLTNDAESDIMEI